MSLDNSCHFYPSLLWIKNRLKPNNDKVWGWNSIPFLTFLFLFLGGYSCSLDAKSKLDFLKKLRSLGENIAGNVIASKLLDYIDKNSSSSLINISTEGVQYSEVINSEFSVHFEVSPRRAKRHFFFIEAENFYNNNVTKELLKRVNKKYVKFIVSVWATEKKFYGGATPAIHLGSHFLEFFSSDSSFNKGNFSEYISADSNVLNSLSKKRAELNILVTVNMILWNKQSPDAKILMKRTVGWVNYGTLNFWDRKWTEEHFGFSEPNSTQSIVSTNNSSSDNSRKVWEVCNKSSHEKVYVAISYKYEDGWRNKGWYNIAKDNCQELMTNYSYRYIYYYANTPTGAEWSGDIGTCVNPRDKFDFVESKQCGKNNKVYKFRQVDLGDKSTYTTTLID